MSKRRSVVQHSRQRSKRSRLPKQQLAKFRTRIPARKRAPTSRRHFTSLRRTPRTAAEFFALPPRVQERWNAMLEVVSKVRSGVSLIKALKGSGVGRQTALRWAGTTFRKLPNARYVAKAHDRLLRVLYVPDESGLREVPTRDSRQGTLTSDYWRALHRRTATGDATALLSFRGKVVRDADGREVPLLTDLAVLDRLASAGEFSFESIYARTL